MNMNIQETCKNKISNMAIFRNKNAMSDHTTKIINQIKLKQRSGSTLQAWTSKDYYHSLEMTDLFLSQENIDRIPKQQLSLQTFQTKYIFQNRPLIITGLAKDWPIQSYSFQNLSLKFGNTKFRIGEDDDGVKLRVKLNEYLQYMAFNRDDSPLYLFQHEFQQNPELMSLLNYYQVPEYFQQDLLSIAGSKRPPFRWFIMGPKRSGSRLHQDPNNTCAWNTLISGHKRWVLFPSQIPKSVIKGKKVIQQNCSDEAIQYFCKILPEIIKSETKENLSMIQFVQKAGQTVFVPGGWWHAVLNLDDTVAVTQNIMTRHNFQEVMSDLKKQKKFLYSLLKAKMKQERKDLYEKLLRLQEEEKLENPSLSESSSEKNGKESMKQFASISSLKDYQQLANIKINDQELSQNSDIQNIPNAIEFDGKIKTKSVKQCFF